MAILKRAGGALFAVAAVAAAVGLSTAPAMASTTLTVKVTNGGTITATAKTTVLSETVKGVPINVTCSTKGKTPASVSSGPVKTGTYKGATPVKVGTVTKLSFNNCEGPLGGVTNKPESYPYSISVDSATNSKGETDGIIGPVKVAVSMTGCTFLVTGEATGYFDNANHTLVVTPKLPVKALTAAKPLTVSDVDGCDGIIVNGQHPTYTGTYSINLKVSVNSTS